MATSSHKKIKVPINGVLLLDKAAGLSSNDALIQAKRMLNAQKAGHTGTLDPFATGVLPLCFGEATKFAQDLLDADKAYDTVLHLGITTSTGDIEGEVLTRQPAAVTQAQVEAVLPRFRGAITQVPPMHSALKRDGRPLYEYARAGITLEREARAVTIHRLELLRFEPPFLSLRVECSKGTYIRVLGEDIGAALGCGAHLKSLRRIRVGGLGIDQAVTIEALAAMDEAQRRASLAPVDALLSSFPMLCLNDELARRFRHGQRLALGKEGIPVPPGSEVVRVYRAADGCLLGTGRLNEFEVLAPQRLLALDPAGGELCAHPE